jgi:hypothetical protein
MKIAQGFGNFGELLLDRLPYGVPFLPAPIGKVQGLR